MATRLVPALIVLFCFSLLLSPSHAGSPVSTKEDEATNLPAATFNEEDVSDLKSLIVLPTESQLKADKPDAVPLVNEEKNQLESVEFTEEFQDKTEVKPIDDGEKKKKLEEFHLVHLRPMNRHFGRMRPIRCRHGHRGPRFGGGPQIWPRMPFWKEEDDEHHHHRHHHGEIFSGRKFDGPRFHEVDPARFAGVDADGRMIGEFKQPHFFFRHPHGPHHHHHHHHHHDDEEDRFHHGDEEEMEHHLRHRRGRGFWKTVRNFFGHF